MLVSGAIFVTYTDGWIENACVWFSDEWLPGEWLQLPSGWKKLPRVGGSTRLEAWTPVLAARTSARVGFIAPPVEIEGVGGVGGVGGLSGTLDPKRV